MLDFVCEPLSARPRHPQDKAKAESAVQNVERWIMARRRHQQFASMHEVNLAMAPLLTRLNEKPCYALLGVFNTFLPQLVQRVLGVAVAQAGQFESGSAAAGVLAQQGSLLASIDAFWALAWIGVAGAVALAMQRRFD